MNVRGQLACAAKRGFGLLEPREKPQTIRYLKATFDEAELQYIRFNDGACDPKLVLQLLMSRPYR